MAYTLFGFILHVQDNRNAIQWGWLNIFVGIKKFYNDTKGYKNV